MKKKREDKLFNIYLVVFHTYLKQIKSPAATALEKPCRYKSKYKTFPLFRWPGLSGDVRSWKKFWKFLSWAIQYINRLLLSPTCEDVILNYTAWLLLEQPLHPSQSIWMDPYETWVVIWISMFEADSQMYYWERARITALIKNLRWFQSIVE